MTRGPSKFRSSLTIRLRRFDKKNSFRCHPKEPALPDSLTFLDDRSPSFPLHCRNSPLQIAILIIKKSIRQQSYEWQFLSDQNPMIVTESESPIPFRHPQMNPTGEIHSIINNKA
jgi:hypothetical protein